MKSNQVNARIMVVAVLGVCAAGCVRARWIENGIGGGWGPVASERALLLDQGRGAQTVTGGAPGFAEGLLAGRADGDWMKVEPAGLSGMNTPQTVVDVGALRLRAYEGEPTVDWHAGMLLDPAYGGISLIWIDDRIAYGVNGLSSVNWGLRRLDTDDGFSILTWSGGGVAVAHEPARVVIDSQQYPIDATTVATYYSLTAGWTQASKKAVHNANGTTAFYVNAGSWFDNAELVEGETGRLTFRITDRTAGSVVPHFYEMGTAPAHPMMAATNNGTYSVVFTAVETGLCDVAFIPSNDARLSLDRIKIEKLGQVPVSVDGVLTGHAVSSKTGFRVDGYDGAGAAGASGSFTTADGKTVTVTGGIVTGIAGP